MKSIFLNTRAVYLIHGVLSVLVLGLMGWATFATLRLESAAQAEAEAQALREHERTVRLAVYQVEGLASAILSRDMLRPSADYIALYHPSTSEIRMQTGEILGSDTGFLKRPSPLLLRPPENPWIRLYFQASTLGGYSSPCIMPEVMHNWPDFEDVYGAKGRQAVAEMLGRLSYNYTIDELAVKYEQAGGVIRPQLEANTNAIAAIPLNLASLASGKKPCGDYQRRKQAVEMINRVEQGQEHECALRQHVVAQFEKTVDADESEFANVPPEIEDEVGVIYRPMLPIWLSLGNHKTPDLAFLRAMSAGVDTIFQGFIVDWPEFRDHLLAEITDRFPDAQLAIVDPPPSPHDVTEDDAMLGILPVRFVPNTQPISVAAGTWSTTHWFLLFGWIASVLMLLIGALAIRSLVTLTERRTQFAYAVTHELRTPLTTFRLYTDMLAQGLVAEENRQNYLETLNQESQRLADLVSGVLEYSRVENKKVPINREPTTLEDVLTEVRENFAPRCESAGMRLDVDMGDSPESTFNTDRHHLVQIIGNLVDNACKYGRNDDEPVVHVEALRSNGVVQFDVSDRGKGVPQRLRTAIFQPYQRGDADSVPATGGIGLGLALSRSWAQLLGGQLELVNPRPGETGARFRVTVPSA